MPVCSLRVRHMMSRSVWRSVYFLSSYHAASGVFCKAGNERAFAIQEAQAESNPQCCKGLLIYCIEAWLLATRNGFFAGFQDKLCLCCECFGKHAPHPPPSSPMFGLQISSNFRAKSLCEQIIRFIRLKVNLFAWIVGYEKVSPNFSDISAFHWDKSFLGQ